MSAIGQTLIDIVRQKAAAEPDFVYTRPEGERGTCLYVYNGEPSCLIGQALWTAGLIDALLEDSDYNSEGCNPLIRGHLGLELENDELSWLRGVQCHQDQSETWADAVPFADDERALADPSGYAA